MNFRKKFMRLSLKAQTMAIKACKPGKTLIDIHNVAVKYITKGLIEAKILRGKLERI